MIEELEKCSGSSQMHPAQIAVYCMCPESLQVILRHVWNACEKDNEGKMRMRIRKMIHCQVYNKSFMQNVLGNMQHYASHSILLQIGKSNFWFKFAPLAGAWLEVSWYCMCSISVAPTLTLIRLTPWRLARFGGWHQKPPVSILTQEPILDQKSCSPKR